MLSIDQPTQAMLARLLAERVEWVTGSPTGRVDPSAADTTVLVLLKSLQLPELVAGTREFAAGLTSEEADCWRRSWTRTRFLFGNPANLGRWNRARSSVPNASVGWLGPFSDGRLPGVGRLLKPVTGTLPALPRELDLPGTGPQRQLLVAIGGLGLVDYLVHLHHSLAEATMLGLLAPSEPLRLSHRPTLEPDPAAKPASYARVLPDPVDPDRLHLHTWLTRPEPAPIDRRV